MPKKLTGGKILRYSRNRYICIFFFACRLLLAVLLLSSTAALVFAQTTLDAEEMRRRAKEEDERQKRRHDAPDVHIPSLPPAADLKSLDLPDEKPCFAITSLILDGDLNNDFPWAQKYLNKYAGRCIGKEGINVIVKRLAAQFMERGFITTRAGLPEQDLTKGTLRLKLMRGVIRNIRFFDPAVYGTWRTAFPVRSGDLLNLRDLEQGLEQMKRVPYQDVDIKLEPGEIQGESDIVITVRRVKFWKIISSLNDSGSSSTGKLQYSVNLSLDNPLGINDIFTIGANHDAEYSSKASTEGYNLFWSMPWGFKDIFDVGQHLSLPSNRAWNNAEF